VLLEPTRNKEDMLPLRTPIACFILTTLANLGFAQGGFRVEYAPTNSGSTYVAAGKWSVRMQHQSIAMQWTCKPFTHVESSHFKTDAKLTAQVISTQGPFQVAPSAASSATNQAQRQDASVVLAMKGTGRAEFLVTVGIDQQAPAGQHATEVRLTIAGL
jgi:hypothetical protein